MNYDWMNYVAYSGFILTIEGCENSFTDLLRIAMAEDIFKIL